MKLFILNHQYLFFVNQLLITLCVVQLYIFKQGKPTEKDFNFLRV